MFLNKVTHFSPLKNLMHFLLVPIYIKDGSGRRTETTLGVSKIKEFNTCIRYLQNSWRGWSVYKSEPPLAFHSTSAVVVQSQEAVHRTGNHRKPLPITAALQPRPEEAMEAAVLIHPCTPHHCQRKRSPPPFYLPNFVGRISGANDSQSLLAVGSE